MIWSKNKPLNYRYRPSGKCYIVFVRTKESSQVEKIVCDFKDEGFTVTLDRGLSRKKKKSQSYRTLSVVIPRMLHYQITKIVVAPPPPKVPVPPMPNPDGE